MGRKGRSCWSSDYPCWSSRVPLTAVIACQGDESSAKCRFADGSCRCAFKIYSMQFALIAFLWGPYSSIYDVGTGTELEENARFFLSRRLYQSFCRGREGQFPFLGSFLNVLVLWF